MSTYPARPLESLQVVIPMVPDRCLAPNRRTHGYGKADAVLALRAFAYRAAMNERVRIAGIGVGEIFVGPVEVSYLVRWPKGERRKDLDSVAVMVKPALDGLCDAGILDNDSQMVRLTVEQEKTTGDGETVISIRRTA